jgi:hypothetical protein
MSDVRLVQGVTRCKEFLNHRASGFIHAEQLCEELKPLVERLELVHLSSCASLIHFMLEALVFKLHVRAFERFTPFAILSALIPVDAQSAQRFERTARPIQIRKAWRLHANSQESQALDGSWCVLAG